MQKSGSREVLDEDSTEQAGAGRSALLTRVRSRGLPTGARWRAAAGRAGAASRAQAPYCPGSSGTAGRDRASRGRRDRRRRRLAGARRPAASLPRRLRRRRRDATACTVAPLARGPRADAGLPLPVVRALAPVRGRGEAPLALLLKDALPRALRKALPLLPPPEHLAGHELHRRHRRRRRCHRRQRRRRRQLRLVYRWRHGRQRRRRRCRR